MKIKIKKTDILYILALFILNTYLLFRFSTITIVNDEFGYWSTAATLAGKDWSGLGQITPYYGYGYGILLVPFFFIFKTTHMLYKASICLNAFMCCISFLVLKKILSDVYDKKKPGYISFVAFTGMVFPSVMLNSNCAWSEICILFFFLILTECFIQIYKKCTFYKIILYSIVTVYLYQIHQRNLGIILAASIALIILLIIKRIYWKDLFLFAGALLILFIIHSAIKQYMMDNLWKPETNMILAVNDFSGQSQKLKQLMTIEGIQNFIISFLGKFSYILFSSCLLLIVCIKKWIQMMKEIVKKIICRRKISLNIEEILICFIFLNVVAMLGLTSISMLVIHRIDTLVYGRYLDFTLPIIISLGLLELQSIKTFDTCITIVSATILGFTLQFILSKTNVASFFYNCVAGIGFIFIMGFNAKYIIIISCIISILFFLILLWNKNNVKSVAILMLYFIFSGIVLQTNYIERQDRYSKNYECADYIKSLNMNKDIFCVGIEDEQTEFWIDSSILQFMLPEYKIELWDGSQKECQILLVTNNPKYTVKIPEIYQKTMSGRSYNIYVKK